MIAVVAPTHPASRLPMACESSEEVLMLGRRMQPRLLKAHANTRGLTGLSSQCLPVVMSACYG